MNDPEFLQDEQLDELMAGYVLGNLSPEEAKTLEKILDTRPDKVLEMYRLQETLDLLPYGLPLTPAPAHLNESILKLTQKKSFKLGFMPGIHQLWQKKVSIIFALILAGLTWSNYRLRQELSLAQAETSYQKDLVSMLQNPKTHLVSLRGVDMASSAAGSIVMTPGEPKSVLILQNLPTLPEGMYYKLWCISDGKKIPSEQFNAGENGRVLTKVPTPSADQVTGIVITLEQGTPSDNVTTPGPMVMSSSL